MLWLSKLSKIITIFVIENYFKYLLSNSFLKNLFIKTYWFAFGLVEFSIDNYFDNKYEDLKFSFFFFLYNKNFLSIAKIS